MMSRPKVAFFDLASCEGCQLQVANLGEQLLEVLELVELVEFRELCSETWDGRYAVAFVEGSVVNVEAEERLRRIRSRSETLVALGSCATCGGINGLKNLQPLPQLEELVYGDQAQCYATTPTRALHQLVPVDYFIPGCPIHPDEFLLVLKAILAGLPYHVPDYAVCVECKFNENVCLYDQGIACLGPVTRAGCNSWCVNSGNLCYGCRGLVSNPNLAGAEEVLSRYGLDAGRIAERMNLYTAALEEKHE